MAAAAAHRVRGEGNALIRKHRRDYLLILSNHSIGVQDPTGGFEQPRKVLQHILVLLVVGHPLVVAARMPGGTLDTRNLSLADGDLVEERAILQRQHRTAMLLPSLKALRDAPYVHCAASRHKRSHESRFE
jgi:hypothetical protein